MTDELKRGRMLAMATAAYQKAYAPYSRYKVGACIEADGKLYTGCNVENSSYGLSICAERSAMVKAVSEGARRVTAVAIATPNKGGMPYPCGACRQFLYEFADPDAPVWVTDGNATEASTIGELLPSGFRLNGGKV